MRTFAFRVTACAAAAILVAALAPFLAAPAAGAGEEITALVASNAEGAFTELIKQFEAKHKGVTVSAQYLGGAEIGRMIDAQKPADVVLVGSTILDPEMSYIAAPTPVLRNKEMILVPKGNPAKVHSLKDLANPGVKLAMGTPTSAVGRLAGQVVQNAAADYGIDFVTNLRKNVVVQKEKGSDVVAAIGNPANAAITFASDVNPAKYDAIEIEEKYNVVSTYSMTVPKNAKYASLGQDFVALVSGPEGQATLKKFHYMAPK
ncbi:MAG TPA: extracellular solute-binding protein [Candidatus Limnocylindria bacterium]|jgi:molybdate transport system substrate-binding protein|nr:extracellular solute-binding protein [Candidatus Limnocylindria bacterium]